MARHSATDNVRKICGCVKWRTCAHPWYVSYREGKETDPKTGKLRERGLRRQLAPLVGREPTDYADAVAEARRAIVAWKDGRNPHDLLPGDQPTLSALMAEYGRRAYASASEKYHVAVIERTIVPAPGGPRRLGGWRATDVTADAIEAFRAQRPSVGANRNLAYLRAAFNWAVLRGLVPGSPFRVGHVAVVKLAREEARSRRLQPGEEERLVLAANGLHDLVIGALETACRVGELLSLQWQQVRFTPRAELFFPGGKTKAKRPRRIPISTALRPILEGRRLDPAGYPLPPDAFVFGDEIGRRRGSIKTAWRLACKRAKMVDLHFHDLRREAASRWMDAGVPLATISRWLGHHNISQTSTYLAASIGNDEAAMRAFEARLGRLPYIAVVGYPLD
jgi:integrase